MLEKIIIFAVATVTALVASGFILTSNEIKSPIKELVSIAFAPILTGCVYAMGKVSGFLEAYPLLQKFLLGCIIFMIALVVLTYILAAIVLSNPTIRKEYQESEKKEIKH